MAGHLPSTAASSVPLGTGKTRNYDSGARYREAWKQGDGHLSEVTDEERAQRNKLAAEINDSYYDFVTDHYEHGWGRKFHFAGYQPGESWAEGHARHEHYLAYMTDIKEGMEVLDLGCGVGGPAREIAIFTGANITGITINQMQVERGNKYTKAAGLEEQVKLQRANMIDLPFPDASFDAVYTIEAWCCAPDPEKAVSEAFRVLKPGGKFGIYEWVNTPVYDDSNELHRAIRSGIERGSAVPYLQYASERKEILTRVGFEVLRDEDRALSKANPIPWWYALANKHAVTAHDRWLSFCLKPSVFKVAYQFFTLFSWLGLTHPSRMEALNTVSQCVYSCRDGGKEGIFSPMHMFICKKPAGGNMK